MLSKKTPPGTPDRRKAGFNEIPTTPKSTRGSDSNRTPPESASKHHSSSWLGELSPFKSNPPALVEVTSKTNTDSFRYTFSPGRGPFNGPLLGIDPAARNSALDENRADFAPDPENAFSTNELQELRRQLQIYLSTQKGGALSDAHSAPAMFPLLGESFELNSKGDVGRVKCALSKVDNRSIRITSEAVLSEFWFSGANIYGLFGEQPKYEDFLVPNSQNNDCAPVNRFLTTDFTITFTHRFISSEEQNSSTVYDLKRRIDSAIANVENIDNGFSRLIMLKTADPIPGNTDPKLIFLKKDESEPLLSTDSETRSIVNDVRYTAYWSRNRKTQKKSFNAKAALGESLAAMLPEEGEESSNAKLIETVTLVCNRFYDDVFNLIDLANQYSGSLAPSVLPRFSDENPSFQEFAKMDLLKTKLFYLELNQCRQHFSVAPSEGNTGVLIFESSTIILSQRMAQYANKTLQNIQADLFLRRARLMFIKSCLEQPNVIINNKLTNIFETFQENKMGLYETLLNDLEHPLFDENDEKATLILNELVRFSSAIKKMRDQEEVFDSVILRGAVDNLMRQADLKAEALKVFCKTARDNSQKEIWRTTKKLLDETSLVPQLRALSEHMDSEALRKFSSDCSFHFMTAEYTRTALKRIVEKKIQMDSCPIVDEIRILLLNIISNYTNTMTKSNSHRIDFLAPITQEEVTAAEGYDPLLMYTIRKILIPRKALMERLEQVEELNAYYVLLEICGSWSIELKEALESAITTLKLIEYKNDGFAEKIKKLILNLPDDNQKTLHRQLCQEKLRYPAALIDQYAQDLFQSIAQSSRSTSSSTTPESYIDERYHQALALPHGFVAFDDITSNWIENNVLLKNPGGINGDQYFLAIFRCSFYIGIFFESYLRNTPQMEESYRAFFCGRLVAETNSWVEKHFTGILAVEQQKEARTALINIRICLSHLIQNDKTPQVYIEELDAVLEKNELSLLGSSWHVFVQLCAWIAALVNRHLFSEEQIAGIHSKINAIFNNEQNPFPASLLNAMRDLWTQYCHLNEISQSAIKEWKNERAFAFESVQKLCQQGEDLFLSSAKVTGSKVFERTLWLNMALQFHHGIKDSFRTQRVSLAITQKERDFFESNTESPDELIDITQKRRMYIVKILRFILSNPDLSSSQRKAVQQCTQDIFKNEEIRTLTLKNAVSKIKKLKKEENFYQITHLMESQIPGFVFSNSECELFADQGFEHIVKQRLKFPVADKGALTIEAFFGQLQAGLDCVKKLMADSEYFIFLPCLMRRLFAAFNLVYQYLTTKRSNAQPLLFVSRVAIELWVGCLESIRMIANTDHGKIRHREHYLRFADAWEKIRLSVFPNVGIEPFICLKQKPSLYELLLAYDVCLAFNEVGFNTDVATTIISEQWQEATGYGIAANAVRALLFILAPQGGHHVVRNLSEKLEKLADFFTCEVEEVEQLGSILCVQVKEGYRLSSLISSQILPVSVRKDGKLDDENISLRNPESLDQRTIDLAKIMNARADQKQELEDYTVLFFYRPTLTSWMHRSADRTVLRCVEVYKKEGEIVRNDCWVGDESGVSLKRASESAWASRAASILTASQLMDSSRKLVANIKCNAGIDMSHSILPEFFSLVLQLVQNSMNFSVRMHALSLTPISAAFLKPSSADYYDPRALVHCNEESLMGIFVLGLIYEELERYETQHPATTWGWLNSFSEFFAESSNCKKNVKNLARVGIVGSGIFQAGSSIEKSPVAIALKKFDEKLQNARTECQTSKQPQSKSVEQYKARYFQEKSDVVPMSLSASDSSLSSEDNQHRSSPNSPGGISLL